MGIAIFDKDNPVNLGLLQSFQRNSPSIGGLADRVGPNELRHAPPTLLRAVGSKTTALAGAYKSLGGNEIFIARNAGDLTYRVMRGNADGTVTNLRTLSDGPALAGGFRSLTAALNASGQGFTDTQTTNNYTVGAIAASSYAHGILRIFCEVAKYNGTAWQIAQYAVFYSVDNGATWNFEYRTVDDDINTSRGRNWCFNLRPTKIYRRNGEPLILVYGDADYLSKAGAPNTGRFWISVFTRESSSFSFSHLGAMELGVISNTDHGHAACAVECLVDGRRCLQVIATTGDGADNNSMRRWIFDDGGQIDPDRPGSVSNILNPSFWTLDETWQHGIAPAGTRGTPGNQVTYMMAGKNEGEIVGLYDNEAGVFGRFVPGNSDAVAGKWETLGPKHSAGGNIALYASADDTGKIVMCMWDDSSRGSGGEMVNFSGSISRSPGVARLMYSPDWGQSWTEVARPDNTDTQMMIAGSRLFWTENSSNIFVKTLPPTLKIRPASVSPGGTNVFFNHLQNDAAGFLTNWLQNIPFSTHTWQVIQRANGVFTDPDTLEVIPDPPCLTDTIMKINVSNTGTQSYGRIAWGRRQIGATETFPQVDTRFWVIPASDSEGIRVGCTGRAHTGGGVNGFFCGGGPRTYGTYHGRTSWYPIYDAGTGWPDANGGARVVAGQFGYDNSNPGSFSFYICPDIGVKGGNGLIGQPIPLGSNGVNGSAPDEILKLTNVNFGSDARTCRIITRIPWDSWHEWCNHAGSDAGVTTRTLWRLYGDANNWIVAEWDGPNHRIQIRSRTSGVNRTTLVLHNGALGAMRETVIDIALGIDGANLAVACSVAGETATGSISFAGTLSAPLTEWQAGANESGTLNAIEVLAVETFEEGGNTTAMSNHLTLLPGFTVGIRAPRSGSISRSNFPNKADWVV